MWSFLFLAKCLQVQMKLQVEVAAYWKGKFHEEVSLVLIPLMDDSSMY